MKRRAALKNLTMGLGGVVTAPTLLQVLASCTSESENWNPLFLSPEEKHIIVNLVDIIIPTSDIPGGLDVNVPQFLDLIYNETEKESNKNLFRKGAKIFSEKFNKKFAVGVLKGKKEEFQSMLTYLLDLSDEETENLLSYQKKHIYDIPKNKIETYSLYHFLLSVRYYTLFGYFTSEKIGENFLNYDPIPGAYEGCVPADEIGNAWSLQ